MISTADLDDVKPEGLRDLFAAGWAVKFIAAEFPRLGAVRAVMRWRSPGFVLWLSGHAGRREFARWRDAEAALGDGLLAFGPVARPIGGREWDLHCLWRDEIGPLLQGSAA